MFLRLVTCSPRSKCKPLKHDATDGKFGGFRSRAINSRVHLFANMRVHHVADAIHQHHITKSQATFGMAAAQPRLRQELRKVVLVTGACGDIGRAICLRLARSRLKDPAFDDFKVDASVCC